MSTKVFDRLAIRPAAGLLFGGALALLSAAASAQTPELTFSGIIASDLIDRGESLTDHRPGAELELEAGLGNGFAGIALRTLRDGTNDGELELFGGLRFDFGATELEFGVARAFGNTGGAEDTEVFLGLQTEVAPGVMFGIGTAYAPSLSRWAELSATAAVELREDLVLSGRIGRSPAAGVGFADLGVTWSFLPAAGLDLRLHHSTEMSTRAVIAFVTEFNLR